VSTTGVTISTRALFIFLFTIIIPPPPPSFEAFQHLHALAVFFMLLLTRW
jgi:hypothetical protein